MRITKPFTENSSLVVGAVIQKFIKHGAGVMISKNHLPTAGTAESMQPTIDIDGKPDLYSIGIPFSLGVVNESNESRIEVAD